MKKAKQKTSSVAQNKKREIKRPKPMAPKAGIKKKRFACGGKLK